ncbi:hypothetical protein LCGC14_0498220 [marine sediment metagenome]|uniref:Uncharacterized protein n=1 Tax=marine sediment metagenome TaxID=412755 RepID=A0A0F9VDD7_9ZZZZ|nr:hypothetical protein [bacterium]
MVMENNNDEEIVEFSGLDNCIEDLYFELETERAIMFGRQKDDKILFVPKTAIKGGWKKDKVLHQTIKVRFPITLFWKERKF